MRVRAIVAGRSRRAGDVARVRCRYGGERSRVDPKQFDSDDPVDRGESVDGVPGHEEHGKTDEGNDDEAG